MNRDFQSRPIPLSFVEASRAIEISVAQKIPPLELESTAAWTVLPPAEMTSAGGATLNGRKDGSILASGKNPQADTYTIKVNTDLVGITAIRLEALTDPSLPCSGPGRASNGNFALDEVRVKAWPRSNPAAAVTATLQNPVADFSQNFLGNWPVAAAIDGNPTTGWSIHPREGLPHAAIFHLQKPIGFSGGAVLEFTLQQGSPPEHNLGRVRLSATTAPPPIAAPKPVEPRSVLVKGQVPASRSGGMLVVYAQMTKGAALMPLGGPGQFLSGKGKLAGKTVVWQPALGTATYPSSWQTWRTVVEPADEPRPWELTIAPLLSEEVELKCSSSFLPK